MGIETSAVDLRDQLDKVVEFCATRLEEHNLSVKCNGRRTVTGEKALLQRAIYNISVNAIRKSPPGAVIDVTITGTASGFTELSISNPVSGIAAEHLPRIFDGFYRVDGARSKSGEGSGLGLATVQSIARLHKGETCR